MKRVVEKVKDIVEVRAFTHLHDFSADPLLTLGGYHFTDITADMMGKWIDRISHVRPGSGAAFALAGFRGVGKSHFLAVVGAIVAHPELRQRITDSHVSASAERLSRRHGSVAMVKRGLGTSLVDELKRAVAELLGVNPATLSDSLYDLLLRASEHSGDEPLVVLIDTAQGRDTRVSRDDGALISEIAEAADTLGIFVGVALDDDISGADGPNSSISANFAINYLDQEHLYKIVDAHVFTKNSQQLPLLREIYQYYREMMPGFRWSEQRFMSLYPLHPATVEIAPLIRLYIQEFALLGFASEAGVRILGRPANSLIGLDEVFDSVETKLRATAELRDVFASYDSVEQQVVSKLPVQQRLQAKLILKGLLMLSLDGQGTTAAEIAASMMIFDEQQSTSSAINVGALLDSFVDALPEAFERIGQDGKAPKYGFRFSAENKVNDALNSAVPSVSNDAVWNTLLKQTGDKFTDVDASAIEGQQSTICSIEWRGGIRRGEVLWGNRSDEDRSSTFDWSIQLSPSGNDGDVRMDAMVWQTAELEPDEDLAIRRFYLLQTDQVVRESLGDGLATAIHVHGIAVEKIWQRVFINDAKIYADGMELPFPDDSAIFHNLTQVLTPVLQPIFELRYPQHPKFHSQLGPKQAAALVAEFFGGSGECSAEALRLAETFAVPLGLALTQNDSIVASAPDILSSLPVIISAFDGAEEGSGSVIPLSTLEERMRAMPYGLTREAQHLVLAALVGQREYEFVTSSGNRINHRSLDLHLIWDDIVGIAKPLNSVFAPDRLLVWAKLTTGNSGLRSLEREEDRMLVKDSLSGWLSAWRESRVLADFDALPEENLNTLIWKTAASLKKTFGAMAEAIDHLVKEEISLDQCIHSIAENFSDSEEEFETKKNELRVLGDFTRSVSRRAAIASYLSVCELTADPEIEQARSELLDAIDSSAFWSNAVDMTRIEHLWRAFHEKYTALYVNRHDAAMGRDAAAESLRQILGSPEWSAFETLYRIAWADQRFLIRSRELIREMRQVQCSANVTEILAERPYCTCSFSLNGRAAVNDLPEQLRHTISRALDSIEKAIFSNRGAIADAADSDAMRTSVGRILELIGVAGGIRSLSGQDLRLLRQFAERAADGGVDSIVPGTGDEEGLEFLSGHVTSIGPTSNSVEAQITT